MNEYIQESQKVRYYEKILEYSPGRSAKMNPNDEQRRRQSNQQPS